MSDAPSTASSRLQRLRVAPGGRYLEREDGTPFFYLGDTAWELFHRTTREEVDLYLANRAAKGFTVVQAAILYEVGGLDDPNAYGEVPLVDRDPLRPNESYLRHVDYVLERAEALGLYVGLLPTWGSHWKRSRPAHIFTPENARAYGRLIGERYRDRALIWVLGGDQNVETDEERAIIDAMAEGLDEGDGGAHLMTFHPRGPGHSSDALHDAPWLDFNMIQSSHAAHDHDNGLMVARDYARQPVKPVVDGEPRYETLQVGFYFQGFNRLDRFDDADVRQAAYWAILAGACGHTYGNNSLWQMWTPACEPKYGACIPWQEALDHPGAFQMAHVRRLFERYSFAKLVPDPTFVVDGPASGGGKVRAACAADGSFAIAYAPQGDRLTVDKGHVLRPRLREIWYDPRYGAWYPVHATNNSGLQTYTPPTSGRGQDWVLVLEGLEA